MKVSFPSLLIVALLAVADGDMSMDMSMMDSSMTNGMGSGMDEDVFTRTHFNDTDYGAAPVTPTLESLTNVVRVLSQMVMHLQFAFDERTRSEGDSGLKQIRNDMKGSHSYHSNSHLRMAIANIHNHVQNTRTLGVGEYIAVLNGHEFTTRHNDYRLQMPHSNSSELFAMEYIPFPEVPQEVLNKSTIDEQITEMREWFKAWATQDSTVRDYRDYFKPVLCYLEGAWFYPNSEIDMASWSDRHYMDAATWFELFQNDRYNSYAGSQKGNENLAVLPRQLVDMIFNQTTPVVGQFNYRMLCQPLNRDLKLNRLQPIDELHYRVPYKIRMSQLYEKKGTRFALNTRDQDAWYTRHQRHTLMDQLMYLIPGLDNQQGYILDDSYGLDRHQFDDANTKLNAARYHHNLLAGKGKAKRTRGFADANLYVAFTTQDRVVRRTLTECSGSGSNRKCINYSHRVSYAIPWEMMYMTPLSKWNPYNIAFKGLASSPEGKTVTAGGRNGKSEDKAYNGSSESWSYTTPVEFFTGVPVGSAPYNTNEDDRAVLDSSGQVRYCRGSGHRIIIEFDENNLGVGNLRQRFPVMPVHGQGNTLWREVDALKEIVLSPNSYSYLYTGYE